MQACPYDAIYIDPENHTAAKCHYCSHRIEIGLEPACVVVCPEQAIVSGDISDPHSYISHLLATQEVSVRKPEQGTVPNLFYIAGSYAALHPTATERAPQTFMAADIIPLDGGNGAKNKQSASRATQEQGRASSGPIEFGARVAEHMVQVSYNAQHKLPWRWQVPAYLLTKGIASGLFLLLSVGVGLKWIQFDSWTALVTGLTTLSFTGLTVFLLRQDLERPERFLYVLFRPQWRSWLTRGAYILVGFSFVAGVWWLLEVGAYFGFSSAAMAASSRLLLLWIGAVLALATAIYTAFLFGQAEGRDLWQSPLLPFHLLVQAIMAGAASWILLDVMFRLPSTVIELAMSGFVLAVVTDLFVVLVGEFSIPHASEVAVRAAHEISHGRYSKHFWLGSIVLGHLMPLGLVASGNVVAVVLAAVESLVGLYLYEYAYVMAPQEVANS